MSPEYSIEGKFPTPDGMPFLSRRKKQFTTLITSEQKIDSGKGKATQWVGSLDIIGKEFQLTITFKKDSEGNPFKTEPDLIDYLDKRYSLSYLRDKSKPAVVTGG